MSLSRRAFLHVAGVTAASAVIPAKDSAATGAPEENVPGATVNTYGAARPHALTPVVVASSNGLRGVERAYAMMANDGADPLDAITAGVVIQELDPNDQSVGLGGLPNEDGVVQLDASCMDGPTRRAGSVASLEGIATPSLVARAVMEYTDHIMLVGPGAREFARKMGFEEQNLLTEESRRAWLQWKSRLNPNDNWLESSWEPVQGTDGTVHMSGVDVNGDVASVTSTSGLAWKIPGRIGDSPIVGAGQYCDNEIGAAGATGRGEAAIKICGAFLVVELMRQGTDPGDACVEALRRATAMTESRLLDPRGRPRFGLTFYAVARDGRYGAATMYGRTEEDSERGLGRFAVADHDGARLEPLRSLYGAEERPSPMP